MANPRTDTDSTQPHLHTLTSHHQKTCSKTLCPHKQAYTCNYYYTMKLFENYSKVMWLTMVNWSSSTKTAAVAYKRLTLQLLQQLLHTTVELNS